MLINVYDRSVLLFKNFIIFSSKFLFLSIIYILLYKLIRFVMGTHNILTYLLSFIFYLNRIKVYCTPPPDGTRL